jgi:hypothetical protein
MSLDKFKQIETGHYVLHVIDSFCCFNATSIRSTVVLYDLDFANRCIDVMRQYYMPLNTLNGIGCRLSYSKVVAVFDGESFYGLNGKTYNLSSIDAIQKYLDTHKTDEGIIRIFGNNKKRTLRSKFMRYFVICGLCGCCCMNDIHEEEYEEENE